MFIKYKLFVIAVFSMILIGCDDSENEPTSSFEKDMMELEKQAAELQEILDSQYDEEHEQLLAECRELAKNPNADPNKVAALEKKIAELESKMGILHVRSVECKYKTESLAV